jgi:hypothetical protein
MARVGARETVSRMTTAAAQHPSSDWTPGRIAAVTGGSLLGLIALGLALLGAFLLFAHAFLRDDDGFFTTPTERLASPTAAITAEELHIGGAGEGDDWVVEEFGGTIRIAATMRDSGPVFVGIARERDLDRYLAGTAHDELDRFGDRSTFERSGGALRELPAPGGQRFWVAQASGTGEQTAEWEVRSGDWAAVVMHADGRRGVDVEASGAAKADWILGIAMALLALAALLAGGSGALIWAGVHRAGRAPHPPAPAAPLTAPEAAGPHAVPAGTAAAAAAARYPVRFEARLDEPLSPWLWLVKWFLAIPHAVVLAFLWVALYVLTAVALVAILFTGRYPRAIFDFNVGVLRWTWRVNYYAFSAIATDRYPPFTLRPADYPCDIDVPYPARLSRGLVLVKWWLLAIPHYAIVAAFLGGGWAWWETAIPGVLPVLVLVAGFVLLFTRRYPRDVFRLVVGINRWILRVAAYALLMRDEYPPFRLED